MRADIYWNLHKNLFSVRALEGKYKGKVVAHCRDLVVDSVSFVVNKAGQRRTVATRCRNVHAYVRGRIRSAVPADGGILKPGGLECPRESHPMIGDGAVSVSYNPYRGPSFYEKDSGRNIIRAESIRMTMHDGRAVLAAYGVWKEMSPSFQMAAVTNLANKDSA